ncbi:MAG: FAD-binding protein [Deferribacteraceae bacterium]|jgi:fumarate reductase flavoprotein subunit|nr:FAD-binding protein [Deferribacteraceae bacterium]
MKRKFIAIFMFLLIADFASAREYAADIVIVGGGWSGLIAAVNAHQAEISTIVLEKAPVVGGQGPFTSGSAGAGHPLAIANGGASPSQYYQQYMEFRHYFANPKLVKRLVYEMANSINWMQSLGVKYVPVGFQQNTSLLLYPELGAGVIERFNKILRNSKYVKILVETRATELIQDSRGAVVGVRGVNADDEEIVVRAKYTIMATGGDVRKESIDKKNPWMRGTEYKLFGNFNELRTGDGHDMCEAVGAQMDQYHGIDTEHAHPYGLEGTDYNLIRTDPRHQAMYIFGRLPYLWVNTRGERFADESNPFMFFQAHRLMAQGGIYYSVFNEDVKQDVIKNGNPADGAISFVAIGQKLNKVDEAFDLGYKTNYVFKANTVEELAKKTGIDPKALRATVDRNNKFADQLMDDELLKQHYYLKKMDRGPYYAVKMYHTIINMNGGAVSDENLQVRHKDGHLIPGLYVTGVMIGGLQSDTYPMPRVSGGTDTSFSISAGRIIVDNIARELGKKR